MWQWKWGLTISQIFALNALIPVVFVLPFAYHLYDSRDTTELRSLSGILKVRRL